MNVQFTLAAKLLRVTLATPRAMATKAVRRVSQRRYDKLPSTQEAQDVKVIIYSQMRIPGTLFRDEDIAGACAERLAAEVDNATVSQEHDPVRWGNSAGLSILEGQNGLMKTVDQLLSQLEKHVRYLTHIHIVWNDVDN